MKKINTIIILINFCTLTVFGQELTQTVRGKIIDADSKLPLIGATVIIAETDPVVGTITDIEGNFRMENIPVGRLTLQLSYMGYESKTIPNIEINSGKEAVLNFSLQEAVMQMQEVVVKPKKNGEAVNEMALISVRSVSLEQTERFAGSMNDPSRILSNFAGITNTQDGSNDIIVRGNSPKYVQWRLEGVEITNPNHFEDQNSSAGGVCALNNNLLATSDFYTGAFSPEYGDVLSGVYDVKLRAGNNEKFESTFGFGILGTDFTVEGPFKKGYSGSYLLNYRYSTIALINDLGLTELDGVLKYQDATFKIVLPTKKLGSLSIFGLSGINSYMLEDLKPSEGTVPGGRQMVSNIIQDYDKSNFLINTGLNHLYMLNSQSFIKTTLAFSGNGMADNVYESSVIELTNNDGIPVYDTVDRKLNYDSDILKYSYQVALTYINKIDAKNRIQIGTKYNLYFYDNDQSKLQDDLSTRFVLVDFDGTIGTLRNFISWKHRFNNITFVSGIHNMNVLYNKKNTIEPRFAINWKLNALNAINLGYGKHSNMERIHNYFTKVDLENGTITEPNKDLDLLKAHHLVLGYNRTITNNVNATIEVYYQYLYNLPVENNDTSYYATINEGLDYRYVDLINKGTGKNYGIELTIERYLSNYYYYLVNASLYQSKYKSLEGIERNTQYNGNYLVNILFGKEFIEWGKKRNQKFSVDAKIFFGGGRKIIPLLRDNLGNVNVDQENNRYWDYSKAYNTKLDDVYQITLSLSYKLNRPKATHEIFLCLNNLTNNQARITEYYDKSEVNSIGYFRQGTFWPNLMYKVYF